MTCGCLIYAYDSNIDYGSQAVLSAQLVIKHLNVPVSLVTDSAGWLEASYPDHPFDEVISIHSRLRKNFDHKDLNKALQTLNSDPVTNGSPATFSSLIEPTTTAIINLQAMIDNLLGADEKTCRIISQRNFTM